MKKTLLLSLSAVLVFAASAFATDFYVNPGQPIWSAIASAIDGDTIHLNPGTYTETFIWITKSLTITGEPYAILDGTGTNKFCFQVKAPNVTIKNLEIKGYIVGIESDHTSANLQNLTIENCNIHDCAPFDASSGVGILLWTNVFDTVLIKNCTITNNKNTGISAQDKAQIATLKITDTIVDANACFGLYLTGVNIPKIQIEKSFFDHSGWHGIGIQKFTNPTTIGDFSVTDTSLSYNQVGLGVLQGASIFTSMTLDGVTIKNNSQSGAMLGGGASSGSLDVENCTIKDNGIYPGQAGWWEEFDLSGGWFGTFSVTGPVNFTGNTFSSSLTWANLYVGPGGSFLSGIVLRCNKFLGGSGKYGIASENTSVNIDAKNNYWGGKSGPNSGGSATKVGWLGTISYTPWIKGPLVALDPSSYDFGEVPVGSTASKTFTISNPTPCLFKTTISGITIVGTNAAEFKIDPPISGPYPIELSPGGSMPVMIVFKPAFQGLKGASLQIVSDDVEYPTAQFLLNGKGMAPIIVANPSLYDYGNVNVNASATNTFTVKNDGNVNLDIVATLIDNPASQFAFTSGGGSLTITPGSLISIVVTFKPTTFGSKAATLQITSNDPLNPTVSIGLSGTGLAPDIDVSQLPYDFGNVDLGATGTNTFTIKNTGNADLTVSGTSIAGAFFSIASGGAPFTLGSGLTRSLVVNFSPTTEGLKTATLSLTSNDPDEGTVTVSLSGTGKSIAMKTFEIEEAKLDWKKKPDDDKIHVKGTYNLPAGASPGPSVTLFVQNLPPFGPVTMDVKENGKKWEYKRPKNGTGFIKEMTIDWKAKEAKFDIHLDDANLGVIESWMNPVTFVLQIGYYKDSETVTMKTHKDKWEYHN